MPFNAVASAAPLVSTAARLFDEPGPRRIEWPDWRLVVPALMNGTATLRELRPSDALSLLSMMSTEEVSRFISPPPTTLEGYQQFIAWTHRKRAAGQYVCFGIVPEGYDVAIGIFQLQMPSEEMPEWGFVMGSPFWGTGLFPNGAEAMLDFAFRGMGLATLGARAAVANGRGNGALRKVGAVREQIIPNGLIKNGRPLDQYYWIVSAERHSGRKVVWDLSAR